MVFSDVRRHWVRTAPLGFALLLALAAAGCGDKRPAETAAPAAPPVAAAPAVPPGHLTEFKQQITSTETELRMKPGAITKIPVRVTNQGTQGWKHTGEFFSDLSYRWIKDGAALPIEGERTRLPEPLTPGASVDLMATIKAPPSPGNYQLSVTMVQEFVAWFTDKGATPLVIPVTVR